MITFDEFKKVELMIGAILSAERVEGSEKLLKLMVNVGEESPRQIIAGIGKYYDPSNLVNRQIVIAANLEPRQLMGLESQGMVLACGADEPVLLTPMKDTVPGRVVR